MDPLTFRQAGVDIEAGDEAMRRTALLAGAPFRREVIGGIEGVAGFVRALEGFVRGPRAVEFV